MEGRTYSSNFYAGAYYTFQQPFASAYAAGGWFHITVNPIEWSFIARKASSCVAYTESYAVHNNCKVIYTNVYTRHGWGYLVGGTLNGHWKMRFSFSRDFSVDDVIFLLAYTAHSQRKVVWLLNCGVSEYKNQETAWSVFYMSAA